MTTNTIENPWDVKSVYDYLFFNCPTCFYKSSLKQNFVNHSFHSHPESIDYFKKFTDNSLKDIILPSSTEVDKEETENFISVSIPKGEKQKQVNLSQSASLEPGTLIKCNKCLETFLANQFEEHFKEAHENSGESEIMSIDNENNDNEYSVEKIVDKSDRFGQVRYLIKWKGYDESDNTWEPIDNLYCDDLIEEFEKNLDNTKNDDVQTFVPVKEDFDYLDYLEPLETMTDKDEVHEEIKLNNPELSKEKLESDYKCDECEKSFSSDNGLQIHISTKHKSPHLDKVCESCGKSFSNRSNLMIHITTVHEKQKDHKCDSCGKGFAERSYLNKHIRWTHEGKKDHLCTICGKAFAIPSKLKKHIFELHENHPDSKCEHCERQFYYKNRLQKHIMLVHEGKKEHICDSCGKAFAHESQLQKHKLITHEGIRHICEKCGKTFTTQSELRKHIYNIHEGRGKKYECAKCKEIFCFKRELQRHTNAKHTNCDTCGKVFKGPHAQSMLKVHIKGVHEGEKNFVCKVCLKKFQFKNDMIRHVDSVHLKKQVWKNIRKNHPGGKRPVVERKCEFCGESFTYYKLLHEHLTTKHRHEVSFDCRKCIKTFPFKTGLYTHLQANHENDSYQCKICQKPFTLTFEKEVKLKTINVKCYELQKCYLCEEQNGTPSQKYIIA